MSIKLMTQKGLLVSEGYGREMRYILPQKGQDFLNMATSEINVATSEDVNVATSETNVPTLETNVPTLEANVATSETKVATSIKKRMSREELQNLILPIVMSGFH